MSNRRKLLKKFTKPIERMKGQRPKFVILDEDKKDFVYLDGSSAPGTEGREPIVACTCGWSWWEPGTTLLKLGKKGKEHSEETGHEMRKHENG